jgi:hypothetical protein
VASAWRAEFVQRSTPWLGRLPVLEVESSQLPWRLATFGQVAA